MLKSKTLGLNCPSSGLPGGQGTEVRKNPRVAQLVKHLTSAQSVKHLTSAQVMIFRVMSSSPVSESALAVRSLLGILAVSSLCPSSARAFSLSQNK